jgi:small-conductance mechanosensitive channel
MGARNSVSTIVRYAGIVIVASWAVSTLGLGLERIALLVSALSVGIGFGLQAITQNFISGLILLAERPVKIGDTIRVGTDEGDVKRINVRSTEIQIGDRSILIIPNSELITKSVRNMTLANPLGRVQIVFSVPMEEDADEIIAILLDLFAEHASVLDDPTPSVMIDSLADGKINFNGVAFVSSPRLAYATRSDLLLRLLRRLKARGVSAEALPPEDGEALQAEP